ncbi:CLUMA_CG007713, isoform A [Clunio marinus]|uniref:CLUMA_CG007713, isoform A n=1 Tax=Clunio marinus TaxID=568069 RepID=A0A1J1I1N4_9DIPT|nr:CLUMA_CG007713, isoform A [Clunio marinus]
MVVLEGANATMPMLTIGNNQYLQPDYLSPTPTMLDSKKSPLALLAQTCSQIGADSNNVKSIVTPAEKNKKLDTNTKQSQPTVNNIQKSDKVNELVFKPYEVNVLSRKNGDDVHRPLSKTSSVDENMSDESCKSNPKKDVNNSRVSSRNSNRESPVSVNSNNNNNNNADNKNQNQTSTEINESEKSQSENNNSPGLTQKESPSGIGTRTSLEMLQGQQKDLGFYKPGFNPFYPTGIDPTNPAFRSSSFSSALSQPHASMLAAAAAGYPASANNPYLSYARIKTPTGGEALVPVCKDPYCTGCQYSAHNQQMLMGVPCPPGCTQCEQQKYGLAMAMSSLPPNHPFAQMSKPFACNWIMNDGYCGRRFSTTDELIQHMKTHSPNLSDPATAASILAAQQSASLMSPLFFPPGMHRGAGYPSASPLSPLSASRYHPYAGKPGTLPTSYGSTFNPPLSAYYPPYSWMPPQRLGTAAHP